MTAADKTGAVGSTPVVLSKRGAVEGVTAAAFSWDDCRPLRPLNLA